MITADHVCLRLSETVDSSPQAEAIVHWQSSPRRVSYAELWTGVKSAAALLLQYEVAPGDRVALVMANSPEYVMAYHAVLACGGVVVPLNTEAKAGELANWISHCGATVVFADGDKIAVMKELLPGARFICANEISRASGELELKSNAAGLASIIYTSGTTGNPKGVMLSHGNLTSNTGAIVKYLGLTAHDRTLNLLPFYYSYGNSVMHTHLATGAAMILGGSLMFPQQVIQIMTEERCTGFPGVPWMFSHLRKRTHFDGETLPSIRYLTQAGAAMPVSDILEVAQSFPGAQFFAMYGQTEATARLTYLSPQINGSRAGSVGLPLEGTKLEIRDAQGRALGPHIRGEVYACGPSIMQGYWRAPEATDAVLRDGWLATGDVGYLDEDGYLYLVGRNSEMIKSGGHRISPLEIEEVVSKLTGVAEAAAFGIPDALAGEVIHVAVVRDGHDQITERSVLAHCKRELSAYKIPKRVEFVTALPKTATGKLQRRRISEAVTLERTA